MTRLLFRALNAPTLILLAMIGVAIQTSLFSFWPLNYIQPDILLLLVIWCALRRDFTEGGVLTLIAGNIAEIHSAAPSGVFLISYMLIYLGVRMSARIFVIPDLNSYRVVTLFASVGTAVSTIILLKLLGANGSQYRHALIYVFPEAVINGILCKWVYRGLEKFDWVTYKHAKSEHALEEDLLLDHSGSGSF